MPKTETAPAKPQAGRMQPIIRLEKHIRETFVEHGVTGLDDDPSADQVVDAAIRLMQWAHPELSEAYGEENDYHRDHGRIEGWKAAIAHLRKTAGDLFSEGKDAEAKKVRDQAEALERTGHTQLWAESASKHLKERDRIRDEILVDEP